jgi:hypothetical protein
MKRETHGGAKEGRTSQDLKVGLAVAAAAPGRRRVGNDGATNLGELRRASDDDGGAGSERWCQAATKHGLNDSVGALLPLGRVPSCILVAIVGRRI